MFFQQILTQEKWKEEEEWNLRQIGKTLWIEQYLFSELLPELLALFHKNGFCVCLWECRFQNVTPVSSFCKGTGTQWGSFSIFLLVPEKIKSRIKIQSTCSCNFPTDDELAKTKRRHGKIWSNLDSTKRWDFLFLQGSPYEERHKSWWWMKRNLKQIIHLNWS